jgi:CspA family cold shock protein
MIKGTVKFFNNAKGFGFITPDDGGKDVFVPAATITQSGSGRLKAGQRVSFETEPDPKGPKAVRLTLLDEPPREVIREVAPREVPKDMARDVAPVRDAKPAAAPRPAVTLYHDPADDESADILDALRDAGHEPRLVDVTLTPPTRDELKRLSLLLREADQSLVRRYDSLFLELQLDDRFISESEFWQGIAEHPQLINGPVVATANKARLARSVHDVQSFLGQDVPPPPKPKGLSARMTAMMNGHPVPPPPPKVEVKEIKKAEAPKEAPKPAPKIVSEPEAKVKKTPALAKPVSAKPAAKPAAKPVKAVKKAAAKPAAKKAAATAKKAAKKK